MDWTVFWISMVIFLFLLDTNLISAVILSSIIAWAVFTVEITEATKSDIVDELNNIKDQLEEVVDKKRDTKVLLPPPKNVKVISINKYGDIKRVYISNSKRSYDEVQMKSIAGRTYACKTDDTCIAEPTMKRHIDSVLYACEEAESNCYPVK